MKQKIINKELPYDRAYINISVGLCDLNCKGCASESYKHKGEKGIPFNEIKEIIDFVAKEISHVPITYAGVGEPLLDPDFWEMIDYSNQKGLKNIVYTNGMNITSIEKAKILLNKCHVVVKRLTLNDDLLNEIVRRPNASIKIQQGIDNLLKAREELHEERKWFGSLSVFSFVSQQTKNDLPDLLRYCRNNNVEPYFSSFITLELNKKEIKDMATTSEELKEIFEKLQKIDEEEFGIITKMYSGSNRYNRRNCRGALKLAINYNGEVYPCITRVRTEKQDLIGSIYNEGKNIKENLSEIVKILKTKKHRQCCICSPTISGDNFKCVNNS